MIEILRPTPNGLKILKEPEEKTWLNVFVPDDQDILILADLLKIPKDEFLSFKENILSLQDLDEIPIIEKEKKYTFIIIRTPQKEKDVYTTIPIGIFLSKDYLITISFKKNEIVEKIKTRKIYFKKIDFFLRFLLLATRTYLNYLKDISKQIDYLEEKLEKHQRNEEITSLLDLQKSLVYFSTSLRNNDILFERMSHMHIFTYSESNEDLLDTLIDENQQAIDMSLIYTNIITETIHIMSSVISNNANRVIKTLTIITVIISVPMIISSFYGMNVNLPLSQNPFAFWLILLICIILSIVLWLTLRWRKLY